MVIVETEGLTKVYGKGETAVTALENINLRLERGEFAAVMGPSGCGKSTLLHLLGGLDRPTSGRVILNGEDLTRLPDEKLTAIRRQKMGFVFQFFNLIPVLTAVENVALPMLLDGVKKSTAQDRAEEWLRRVGLEERGHHHPDQLSGGQQQRVAIARALVSEPDLILADEPTGNLDSRASDEVAAWLRKIVDEYGRTILMVTHDPRIAAYADRIIFLKDGTVVDDTHLNGNRAGEASVVEQKLEEL